MSILPYEAKTVMELFCLQPIIFGCRQNSFSSALATRGKIKIPNFTWTDQDWIGLMIFKNLVDQDWIGFNFVRSGLDSNWKSSQSAHLCQATVKIPRRAHFISACLRHMGVVLHAHLVRGESHIHHNAERLQHLQQSSWIFEMIESERDK